MTGADTSDTDAVVQPEVLFEVRGRAGVITLNRPRAINALTHGMVGLIAAQLTEWVDDEAVGTVVLVGSGTRGLCAGGDIVSLYRDATAGDGRASLAFWHDEYALNAQIARYPKPYVAIMDGIVLGGGIGLSAHASHRIVTEKSSVGLPETGIGFVPDVGASWLLSRAPGELGTYAALTAGSLGAGDGILLGLADSFVPTEALPRLLSDLEVMDADVAIAAHARPAPDAPLAADRDWIDAAFSCDSVPEIVARLAASPAPRASEVAATIEAKSPLAVSATLEELRRARSMPDLEAALEQEFRVSAHGLTTPDFAEGVRAQVIDKDRHPAWTPPTLAEVSRESVLAYFNDVVDQNEGEPWISRSSD